MKTTFTISIILFSIVGHAQIGSIKGRVIDKDSEVPIMGATIELLEVQPPKGTITDFDGYFLHGRRAFGKASLKGQFYWV